MAEDSRAYQGKPAYRGLTDDGRRLFIFSQSAIKAVEICPERGRRNMLKLDAQGASESTAMGTAFHLALELDMQSVIDGQGVISQDELWVIARDHFLELMELPGYRYVKIKTPGTIGGYLWEMLDTYTKQVYPTLSPQAVELHLGPYTIYEDSDRVIQLEGTADYLDSISGLADWKTAGRRWEAREHQKWDVQPTVYTWLAQAEGDMDVARVMPSPWTWHVFYTNGEYEKIETTRGEADWAWLKERCLGLAIQLEANLPEWFKNPTTWLCSERYCDAFADCRGKYVS